MARPGPAPLHPAATLPPLAFMLNVLGALVQDEVSDHARDGDAEAEGRIVHGLCDAAREDALAIRRAEARGSDGPEGVNEPEDGAEEADEGGDVRERPERPDAL